MVIIDEEIRAMIPAYLERRAADHIKLVEALTASDFAFISSIAHQIKGHAASFGFDDLEEIAINLEKSATEKDKATCQKGLDLFSEWLERHT